MSLYKRGQAAQRAKRGADTTPIGEEPVGHYSLVIYISNHCPLCAYAYLVAEGIQQDFPTVTVRLVNLAETEEAIPEAVFATPTYLLNGRGWSLGNPSPEKINETFRNFPPNIHDKEQVQREN